MKSLNIDTVNFKRLLINGKEFYSTSGRTILNTLFLGDEVITLTSSDFTNGIYETNRTDSEDPIRKYTISTTDAIVNITVTKVDNIHFTINSTMDKLYKVDYISIGTVPYIIKYRDYVAGVWTYTLDRDITSSYTTVTPVYTLGAYDKDDAYLTPSLIKVDSNVKVYYKDVYTNDDSIRYLKLYTNKTIDGCVGDYFGLYNRVSKLTATGTGNFTVTGDIINTGTSGVVTLGNLHGSSNVVTVSAYITWNGDTNKRPISMSGMALWLYAGNIGFTSYSGPYDLYGMSSSGFANTTKHIVAVFDPSSTNGYGTLYVDGVKQILTQKLGTRTARNISNSIITLFPAGYTNFGNISNIKVFNRAVTDEEAYQLFNGNGIADNIKIDLFTQRNINKLTNIEWETLSTDYKITVENTKIVSDGSIIIDNQIIELENSVIEITSI